MDYAVFWSNADVSCLEPYIPLRLAPGQTAWRLSWLAYTNLAGTYEILGATNLLDAFEPLEFRRARHGGTVPKVRGLRDGNGGKGDEGKSELNLHGSFS